jgi:hypothetical protein
MTRPTGVVQEGCAVIRQIRRISSIVTLAAHAAASTAMRAATTESSALWPGLIHCEGTPFQGLSVQSLDGALHVFFIGKLDEAKPSGFARHLIPDDCRGNNLEPSVGHKFAEHAIGHTTGKISHE